jgi:hypothetical protein
MLVTSTIGKQLPETQRSVFHLQKVLGHSSLEMTRRYANLMTES